MKILFLSGCIFSLSANSPNTLDAEDTEAAEMYIRAYLKTAIDEMERAGMPASVIMAQGMLESSFGQSELAQKAHNHFGLKCGAWSGDPYYKRTQEYNKEGQVKNERACFRSYENAEQSFKDHSAHVKSVSKYKELFHSKSLDYKFWAEGLYKAGYATDPEYASKLINLIERYDLARYDNISNKYELANYEKRSESYEERGVEVQTDILALNNRMELLENSIIQALQLQKELSSLQKDLKLELQNLHRNQQLDKESLNNKLNALDGNMMAQAELITEMQAELDKVSYIQKAIIKADPLSGYFNEDGTPKKQLDIFPTRHRNRDGIFYQSGRKATTLTEGQGFEDIANVYGVDIKDLRRFNDLAPGEEQKLPNGCYIYLEPKANMASGESGPHTVQTDENLHSISQRYGVKISKLYARNNLKKGEEPAVGEFIFLNETVDAKPRVRVTTEDTVTENTDRFGGGGSN